MNNHSTTSFSGRLINLVLNHRPAVVLTILALTVLFSWKLKGFVLSFDLTELLPVNHPYVRLYRDHRQFGQANTVYLMLEVKQGDIYRPEVLEKISRITQQLDRLPGVNHYQVLSLSQKKVKHIGASEWGLEIEPLMGESIPRDQLSLEELKRKVRTNPFVYGLLVSVDEKAALISAGFLDELFDYSRLYKQIERICRSEENGRVTIYRAGQPLLLGRIHNLLPQTLWIALTSLGVVTLLLFWYLKDWRLALIPLVSMALSGIWGFGLAAWLNLSLNPLMIVIPILISARVLSHSVQMTSRFRDACYAGRSGFEVAREAGARLFQPGWLAVLTDALGITVIILTPLPVLQKLGILGTLWILNIVVLVLILNPVLLSLVNFNSKLRSSSLKVSQLRGSLESIIAGFLPKNPAQLMAITSMILIFIGIWTSRKLSAGDPQTETPLLWPNSSHNLSVKRINANFPGTEQLTLVVQGKKTGSIQSPGVLKKMEEFQRFMSSNPQAGGSLSLVEFVKVMNRKLHYDDPKWEKLPDTEREVAVLLYMYTSMSDPGDLDRFTDYELRNASITFFFKNHQSQTVQDALAQASQFIRKSKVDQAEFRLASGSFGLLAAANQALKSSHRTILFLTFALIFFSCAWSLQSWFAAVLLSLGLLLANSLTSVYMYYREIGLNLHTLPVLCIGIGVGVDYGIYLLFKLREDFSKSGNYFRALSETLTTAGKPIIFTALVLTAAVAPWYVLSELRFQAEMGLLLGFSLILNLISANVILPILIWLTKPKFIFGRQAEPIASPIGEEEGKHAQILEPE